MELRKVAVEELKRADYNPRVELKKGMPGYEKLARSLKEFDLVQPLVWNEQTGNLVGGHQRLSILKDQGVEAVDVVVVSLSLEKEKSLNVVLNNQRIGGDWDSAKLGSLLDELAALPEFDVSLTGFNEADIHDLQLSPREFESDEEESDTELIQLHLEIPKESWDAVRTEVDRLMQVFGVRVHRN